MTREAVGAVSGQAWLKPQRGCRQLWETAAIDIDLASTVSCYLYRIKEKLTLVENRNAQVLNKTLGQFEYTSSMCCLQTLLPGCLPQLVQGLLFALVPEASNFNDNVWDDNQVAL